MKATGVQDDKLFRRLFALAASPLPAVADRFGKELDRRLLKPVLLQQIQAAYYLPPMDFDPREAIILGLHDELKVPIAIHRDRLTENLLVIGSSGSGKTMALFWIMDQLAKQGISIVLYDFKGEASRLLNVYGQD